MTEDILISNNLEIINQAYKILVTQISLHDIVSIYV